MAREGVVQVSDPASQQHPAASETLWRVLLWCLVALAMVLQVVTFAGLPGFLENYAEFPVKLKPIDERGPLPFSSVRSQTSRPIARTSWRRLKECWGK